MPNLYLTNDFVSRAKCPPDKDQIIYWDHPKTLDGKIRNGSQSGLGFRVTSQGAKAYIHMYRFNGVRKRQVIGKPTTVSVAAARLLVQNREEKIEEGLNPNELQIDYRQSHTLTLRDLIDQYVDLHLNKTSQKHQNDFARLIAPWHMKTVTHGTRRGFNSKSPIDAFGTKHHEKPAESITPMHVDAFVRAIPSDSVANAALKYLNALFNWGYKMQLIDMRNPCSPIAKRKIIRRKPDYTPDDVAQIAAHIFNPSLEALESQPENTPKEKQLAALARGSLHRQNAQLLELCHFMGILMLTMARPVELKLAKFEHFDLERLIWKKHNTKGIKLSKATYEYAYRSVPIHPRVAAIVKDQRQRWPDADYLFPSHVDQTTHRDNFQTVMKRFKNLKVCLSTFKCMILNVWLFH